MGIVTIGEDLFPEGGTRGVVLSFVDEDGAALVPNTITWTLTNRPPFGSSPTVINSRENVDVTPASSVTVVLSGLDLALLTGEENSAFSERVLTIKYTYDSTLGSDLPDRAEYVFRIQNLKNI